MGDADKKGSDALAIEKQKTLRLLVIVIPTLVLALGGLFMLRDWTKGGDKGGKVEIDLSKGVFKLDLEQPIVEQADVGKSKISTENTTIEFTQGKLDDPRTVEALSRLESVRPDRFSGKNFINREAGFVLTVEHPERWQVTHNPAGMVNSSVAVNTIYNQEGSHLNIGVGPVVPGTTIEQFVAMNVQTMFQAGMLQQMPEVSYDQASQTAFAIFTNPMTGGQSYQKVVIDGRSQRVFVVSANYNQQLSSPAMIEDLRKMIATFTVIEA